MLTSKTYKKLHIAVKVWNNIMRNIKISLTQTKFLSATVLTKFAFNMTSSSLCVQICSPHHVSNLPCSTIFDAHRANVCLVHFGLIFNSNRKCIFGKIRPNMAGGGKMQTDIENRLVYKAFSHKNICWELLVIFWQYQIFMSCVYFDTHCRLKIF